MNTASTTYNGHFDNIWFTGTVSTAAGSITNGLYLSINDTPPGGDTDGDGILDIYETNTGIYNGPTDTGTDPNNPDSDGDGQNDGDEVVAGTDPNDINESFEVDTLTSGGSGFIIEWFARTGRVYAVHYLEGSLTDDSFAPLNDHTNITVAVNGTTNVVDTTASSATGRFYRVQVYQP